MGLRERTIVIASLSLGQLLADASAFGRAAPSLRKSPRAGLAGRCDHQTRDGDYVGPLRPRFHPQGRPTAPRARPASRPGGPGGPRHRPRQRASRNTTQAAGISPVILRPEDEAAGDRGQKPIQTPTMTCRAPTRAAISTAWSEPASTRRPSRRVVSQGEIPALVTRPVVPARARRCGRDRGGVVTWGDYFPEPPLENEALFAKRAYARRKATRAPRQRGRCSWRASCAA